MEVAGMNLKSCAAYFTHVEARYKAGTLSPLSCEGQQMMNQLIAACEQLKVMTADRELAARRPSETGREFDDFLDVVDLHMRLVLLMGEFKGHLDGVKNLVARCGSQSQYLI